MAEHTRPSRRRAHAKRSAPVDSRRNEALFRQLISSVRDYAIFMLDPQGHVATWNEGAARIKGYAEDEIVGKDYRCFFPSEDLAAGKPDRLLEAALRDGHVEDQGWRVRKDGSRFLADAVITALVDARKRPIGFAKVTRDVTERVRAQEQERALAASEQVQAAAERIRAFAANVPGLAYRRVLGPDGSVTYPFVGGRYSELLNLSRDAAMQSGGDLMQVTHPDDRATVRDLMERSARDLSAAEIEARMVLASGEVRWMHSRSTPRRQRDGSTVWDVVAFDVTERRHAEERLRLLQSTSLAVAEAADFDSALLVVLQKVCSATGWAYGSAWFPDSEGTRLVAGPTWGYDDARLAALMNFNRTLSIAMGVGVVGAAWQTRDLQWVPDLASFPNPDPERKKFALAAGVTSVCAVPILAGDALLAVLNFSSFERRERDEGLAATISAVATQLGNALQRKRAEQALRDSEERLDRAQGVAGIGSWELDVETGRYDWSRHMFQLRGLSEESFRPTVENLVQYLHPDDVARCNEWVAELKRGKRVAPMDVRIRRPDEKIRIVSIEGAPLGDASGKVARIVGTMRDVTEAREAQRQLAQAQKMEAIGSLTGGLAHDFNNLLAIIIGNLDLLDESLGENGEPRELVSEALGAATRGADLVRRLLAFARQQPLQPERLDVGEHVAETAKLLRRTLGEDIEIAVEVEPEIWPVIADRAQLEAAIANLATNARDAMPRGGRLAIAVRKRHLDAEYASLHPEVISGDYTTIEVSDSGTGMSPEVINRIFEPFFTTKEQGKGTGLGLSMVFGFIKQSGGHVSVYSEVGVGTAFRLYLPRAKDGTEAALPASEPPARVQGGGEMILAVEDNAHLRRVLGRQLRELGYPVLFAESGRTALEVLERMEGVRLLFSDIVMPGGMSGFDLAREATARWPRLRVLLTSGFPDAGIVKAGGGAAGPRLLSKPYRKEELARALRQALEGEET